MKKMNNEVIKLREKLFDIELIVNKIQSLNNLLLIYSNENCSESFIIAEQISKQIDEINAII